MNPHIEMEVPSAGLPISSAGAESVVDDVMGALKTLGFKLREPELLQELNKFP